ncbi:protein export cytoplasm protein SecA ATPase RNA helicase [Halalkalibacter wakoensis JCM 9140]|uniref:Protein translocase subunit SecA n=1 Tax=Halalkalibacter wakoensis JCM 9140 TaxID=1236970 RepID=W4Q707_9BACI|nr:accessory Sec system translocase SecA2 [Halalkalibacter wakoensis]GAE27453.1 protein export cytoplasm protein SecA ATPase RNA helicase [Halalkalibacter wakoensis JCM 9140]
MLSTMKKLIGDGQERKIKKYRQIVDQINSYEASLSSLSDGELQAKTTSFKDLLEAGQTVDDIKAEAFAVVREASKRVLGLRHYDSQLIGGLVLSEGDIAEMPTGEGKTLVASLPSYLRALEGKGVHVITVNEYLAERDRNLIGKVHEFLGLSVGLNIPNLTPDQKQAAYLADITYGIGNEFGFDYLRDNMLYDYSQRSQRPFHFAIIDEIDSVLIDEAKTPLIIAGKTQVNPSLYNICAKFARGLKEETDYMYDPVMKSVSLTDEAITKVERAFGIDNLYDLEHQTLFHFVLQAVRAHVMFSRDVDYIIKDGEVQLVDMFTGRVMEGRSFSDGLHQALEAKEGVEITEENKTQALVTIQNYFRMYPTLCGMTGTAKTEEKEFQMLYGMHVIQVPTNKPRIRVDQPDFVFKTKDDKYKAVTKEVIERHKKGQPVLIGTTSIIQSETMAEYLDKESLNYELLNAKSVEREVDLISKAGQKSQITIATNMAGRGTDIELGEGVAELGGLYVIGTERHESRRIDNQLRGRSGRQGDPGESRLFISLEDDIILRFGEHELEKMKGKLSFDENGLVHFSDLEKYINRIQRNCEHNNYATREYTLKLDDIINEQRNVVYGLRDKALLEEDLLALITPMIASASENIIDHYCTDELLVDEWDLTAINRQLNQLFPQTDINVTEKMEDKSEVQSYVREQVNQYVEQIQTLTDNQNVQMKAKQILLMTLDIHWLQHIDEMDRLKEGIGLRGYSQEDPMRIYNRESYALFTNMYQTVERDVCIHLAKNIKPYLEA